MVLSHGPQYKRKLQLVFLNYFLLGLIPCSTKKDEGIKPGMIELDSLENADILEAREMLLPILKQERDDKEKKLSQDEVMILRSCFEKYHEHPSNLQHFYDMVKDLTNVNQRR